MELTKQLNAETTSSSLFSEEILQKAREYANLTDSEKKEKQTEIIAFRDSLKKEYEKLDAELKTKIEEETAEARKVKEASVQETELTRQKNLKEAEENFRKEHEGQEIAKKDRKSYSDIVNGINIVAKRAVLHAGTVYEETIKASRVARYDLIADYMTITKALGFPVGMGDKMKAQRIDSWANRNFVNTLKSKKTWVGLVPLFMLILIIVAYFIGKSITGYSGSLGDVINNGIFVAVVATGAVYIYSQGGFDMSLGAASLMCATVAAIVWNKTTNVGLTITLAILLGAGLGVINAILATMLNLPVMVMTLTMMNILGAINEELLGSLMYPAAGLTGNAWVYAAILAVFFLFCWFIFNYTKVGRRNKFIGSNKTAARFNGINLMQSGIISFGISGIGLGLCGFIFVCTKSATSGNFGTNTVLSQVGLNVVIAIIFGGMTTSGGPKSKVSCAIIGAFFSVFMDEFFAAISTPTFAVGDYSYMFKGIIFIIVSMANMWDTRGKMLASGGSIQ